MKNILYTLSVILLMVSCRSVEKMVEKGDYDGAFNFAISKLQGKKNKKTEYVVALEKAYFKLNKTSYDQIESLNAENRPENWPLVLDIYQRMENRKTRLEPLLPLVSENGYMASFDMSSIYSNIKNAEENTCLYYYNRANDLLSKSERTGDKLLAKDAFAQLNKLNQYRSNYKDAANLKEKALRLGLTVVSLEVDNGLRDFMSSQIEIDLKSLPLSSLDNLWYDFVIDAKQYQKTDYTMVVRLDYINFSPERERINTYADEKEIIIRKEKERVKRDSLHQEIEKVIWGKVRATVSEIYRDKRAELTGTFRLYDNRTNEYLKTVPINVFQNFSGYACQFRGDERALSDESKSKMDPICEGFPTNNEMSYQLSTALGNVVMAEAKRLNI